MIFIIDFPDKIEIFEGTGSEAFDYALSQSKAFAIYSKDEFDGEIIKKSDDEFFIKAKKDLSKLQKVKKIIYRQGKPVLMTTYVKPKTGEDQEVKKEEEITGNAYESVTGDIVKIRKKSGKVIEGELVNIQADKKGDSPVSTYCINTPDGQKWAKSTVIKSFDIVKKAYEGKNETQTETDEHGFTFVKNLGGSTGAVLVEKDGKKYVRKTAASKEHLNSEIKANKIYNHLGKSFTHLNVPKIAGHYEDTGYAYFEYIQGDSLKEWMRKKMDVDEDTGEPVDNEEVNEMRDKIKSCFVLDALLSNWDVVGADMDNIIISPDGKPYRVDVGGSLLYRAQGAPKGDAYKTDSVPEINTLRDENTNPTAAAFFGSVTTKDIQAQLEKLKPHDFAFIKSYLSTDKNLHLDDRFKYLKQHVQEVKIKEQGGSLEKHVFPADLYDEKELEQIKRKGGQEALDFYGELNDALQINEVDDQLVKRYFYSIGLLEGGADSFDKRFDEITLRSKVENINKEIVDLNKFAENNGISPMEAFAIHYYSTDEYTRMNKALLELVNGENNIDISNFKDKKYFLDRSAIEVSEDVREEMKKNPTEYPHSTVTKNELAKAMLKFAMRGIAVAEKYKGENFVLDKTIYRNLGSETDFEALKKDFDKVGSTISQTRFSSTSFRKIYQPGGYSTKKISNPKAGSGQHAKMRISSSGVDISSIAYYNSENEILLKPFSPLHIDKYDDNPDTREIRIKASHGADTFEDWYG